MLLSVLFQLSYKGFWRGTFGVANPNRSYFCLVALWWLNNGAFARFGVGWNEAVASAKTLQEQQELGGCGWDQNRKHFCTAVSKCDSLWSRVCADECWGSSSLWKCRPQPLAPLLGVWLGPWRHRLSKKWRKQIDCASLGWTTTLFRPNNMGLLDDDLQRHILLKMWLNVFILLSLWLPVMELIC